MNRASASSGFQTFLSAEVIFAVVILLCLVSAIFYLGYALFKRLKTTGRVFSANLEKEYPVTEQDRADAPKDLPESHIPRAQLRRDTRTIYILLLVLVAGALLMLRTQR